MSARRASVPRALSTTRPCSCAASRGAIAARPTQACGDTSVSCPWSSPGTRAPRSSRPIGSCGSASASSLEVRRPVDQGDTRHRQRCLFKDRAVLFRRSGVAKSFCDGSARLAHRPQPCRRNGVSGRGAGPALLRSSCPRISSRRISSTALAYGATVIPIRRHLRRRSPALAARSRTRRPGGFVTSTCRPFTPRAARRSHSRSLSTSAGHSPDVIARRSPRARCSPSS